MGELDGRVAIVTGSGQGLGRAYATRFADEGAKVVVHSSTRLTGENGATSADTVAQEIRSAGGEAVAHAGDISEWDVSRHLVETAVEHFGGLDILVNNAGVIRDRTLVNLTEEEWDTVVDVHLKAHAAAIHWAAAYWRQQHKEGTPRQGASVVNTTAGSGLFGNAGQANYASAKAGVAALTVVAARELERYGVRVNCIAPVARSRMMNMDYVAPPEDPNDFDVYDPANVAAVACYLASERCHFTGRVVNSVGGNVALYGGWHVEMAFDRPTRWTIDELVDVFRDTPQGPPPFAPPQPAPRRTG